MTRQKILMNPGPRFEEICALHLYQLKTGQTAEILFRDTDGDPGPAVPDIDVREPYPSGSSAFEQMALKLNCADEFADLIRVFNDDNQSGYLNRRPFRQSFISLIPRLFDLTPADTKGKLNYRRFIIAEAGELAELAFWAYDNQRLTPYLKTLTQARPGQLKQWPQRQNFVKNWPSLADAYPSPLTLSGYACMRFLREEKVEEINLGLRKWQALFDRVHVEFGQTIERLQAQDQNIFRIHGLWAGYLMVNHNFDTRAFFSLFRDVQVLVAYDQRGRLPQAVIQVRHGTDLRTMMERLSLILCEREPDCWHYSQRAIPGPTGTLLNGGRNRFRERGSLIAADPQTIFALMNECI
ncbi:hypothetical protein KJ611_01765 [Patescibacteria group bacterium]|nr:hypothetical protein [Patescibacteria group bacterium]MBU1705130.1 hypothetical protein [Patescibacteria group bacterium]